MKRFYKKMLVISSILIVISFDPHISFADTSIPDLIDNYTISTAWQTVTTADPTYDENGNLVISRDLYNTDGTLYTQVKNIPGWIFNGQKNAIGQNGHGIVYSGLTTGYRYTYGAQGSVYAQSWKQTICKDSDSTTSERVCPTGSTLNVDDDKCYKTESTTTSLVCPTGVEEDDDGNCMKEISSKTQTPTCPTSYTLSGNTCIKESTYSCPDGYTLSGTYCTKETVTTIQLSDLYLTFNGNTTKYYLSSTTSSTYTNKTETDYTIDINKTGIEFSNDKVYKGSSNYYVDCTTKGTCKYRLSTSTPSSCPTGYTKSNNTCTKTTTETIDATLVTYPSVDATCETGYSLENGSCVAQASTVQVDKVCPTGYTLNSNTCIRNVTVEVDKTCPTNYRMLNGNCQKIKCENYEYSNEEDSSKTFEDMVDENKEAVEVRKTVTQTQKFQKTGIYKVEFSARATGITYKPYVVIVFDNSNSMSISGSYSKYKNAIEGYKTFANDLLAALPDAQIAMVSFAGGFTNTNSSSYCKKISNGTNTYSSTKYNEVDGYFVDSTNTTKKYSMSEYLCLEYGVTNGYGTEATDSAYDDAQVLKIFPEDETTTEKQQILNLDNVVPPQPGTSEQFGGAGSTNLYAGLYKARELLKNKTGPKYIVVISDGVPTTTYCVENEPETIYTGASRGIAGLSHYYKADDNGVGGYSGSTETEKLKNVADDTIDYANIIKENDDITIFTLGYEMDSTGQSVMDSVSSGTGYSYTGTKENIDEALKQIKTKITELWSTKVIDSLGIEFNFDNFGPTSGIQVVGEPVVNYATKLNTTFQTMGYFYIKIDPETADGWYDTNNGFVFHYIDGSGNEQTIECLDDPKVWWEQLKHTYTIKYFYDEGNGEYIQQEWSPDTVSEEFKLTKVGGVITDTFGPTSEEVNSSSRTNDYEYILEVVKYQNEDGETILKNNGAYTATMTTVDEDNVICVYYKKIKRLSLTKKLENMSGDSLTNDEEKLEFKFKIEFSELPEDRETYKYKYNSKTYNFTFNENNKFGYVTLKSGETISFVNLPSNITYTITELDTEGYAVNITKDGNAVSSITNQILSDSDAIVFTNLFGYELPETGSHGGLIMIITSIFLLGVPVIYIAYNFYIDSKKRISWRCQ